MANVGDVVAKYEMWWGGSVVDVVARYEMWWLSRRCGG